MKFYKLIDKVLLEAKDIIKSDNPNELLAKHITGSQLYQTNKQLRSEADQIADDIINKFKNIQKEKGVELINGKDIMSLINSLLMMSNTTQYVNKINGDETNVNKNIYEIALPVLLHDYKDALDNKETLLQNPQFITMFQKGIPKWLDIVHSIQGKEKHTKREIKQNKKPEEGLVFENDEVAVYLANDTENPVNSINRCKLFGKGSTLCISGSNANYHYHDYRWNQNLTTYFCYLKKREHYMLVDVTENNSFQYNAMFSNGKQVNVDSDISKGKLLKLYPELEEPLNKDVFVSVPIEGNELIFYEKFYNKHISLFKTPEDRLKYASFNQIGTNDWKLFIPKEEWKDILEYAIYVTEDFDIPEHVFEGKDRLYKQYLINVKRRVEEELEEWDEEDGVNFTPTEYSILKDIDIDKFPINFIYIYSDTFEDVKSEDPKYKNKIKEVKVKIEEIKKDLQKNYQEYVISKLKDNIYDLNVLKTNKTESEREFRSLQGIYNAFIFLNKKISNLYINYILDVFDKGLYGPSEYNDTDTKRSVLGRNLYYFIKDTYDIIYDYRDNKLNKKELNKVFNRMSKTISEVYDTVPFIICWSAYKIASKLNYLPIFFYDYIPDEVMKYLEEYKDSDITSEPLHPYEENAVYDLMKAFLLKS